MKSDFLKNEMITVPREVKIITGKDKKLILKEFEEFEKNHFVSHHIWALETVLVVFYWDEQNNKNKL